MSLANLRDSIDTVYLLGYSTKSSRVECKTARIRRV